MLLHPPTHTPFPYTTSSDLADADVNVDMIIQSEPAGEGSSAEVSFTVPRDDLRVSRQTLEGLAPELGISSIVTDEEMGKVSDRKSTRLNSSHANISYAVFCL